MALELSMMSIKKVCLLSLTFFLFSFTSWNINTQEKVLQALNKIYLDDQRVRSIKNMSKKHLEIMKFIDKINIIKVKSIIRNYNWPFDTFITKESSKVIFLVIQHSTLDIQKENLELVKQAVTRDKLSLSNIALLVDRIAIQEGNLQIYGTQVNQDLNSSKWSVFPIKDVDSLDKRRKIMGLPPIAEYLKLWDIKF